MDNALLRDTSINTTPLSTRSRREFSKVIEFNYHDFCTSANLADTGHETTAAAATEHEGAEKDRVVIIRLIRRTKMPLWSHAFPQTEATARHADYH